MCVWGGGTIPVQLKRRTEKEDILLRWCEYRQQLFGQPAGDQGYSASADSGEEELPSPRISDYP